jgi:hypothetical protein
MSTNQRTGLRIPLEFPVEVRWKSRLGNSRQAKGKTGNISGNGLFMSLPVRPPRKTPLAIRVLLPPTTTLVPVELTCNGRVVRWSCPGESTGVGATIDEYELHPTRTQPI